MLGKAKTKSKCKGDDTSNVLILDTKKIRRVLVNSIPVLSIFALVGIISYAIGINVLDDNVKVASAAGANTTNASASLTIDDNVIKDEITTVRNSTAYASHKVKLSASDIDGYTLTITGPINLTAPSGSDATSSEVAKWGYAWAAEDATESGLAYNNFTGSTQNLETNAGIANNSVELTKKLAFAATFTDNASDGHYTGRVGLNLTVTPKTLSALEQISTMQQMTPDICSAAKVGDTAILIDGRDGSEYTIRKHSDNKCWMTQNLRIVNKAITSSDSDVTSNFTIPASNISSFGTSYNTNSAYYNNNTDYGAYYSWYTATAGAGTNSVSSGDVTPSICPKGWRLPSRSDYSSLATAIGAGNDAAGSTLFRNSTYKFQYAGLVGNSSLDYTGSDGHYWSRTAVDSDYAYYLFLNSSNANPADGKLKYRGFSVRCVTQPQYTYTLEYNSTGRYIPWGMASLPSPQTTTTSETSLQLEVAGSIYTKDTSVQQCGSSSSYSDQYGNTYAPGSTITLTPDRPHLILTISGTSSLGKCYSA